jgi:hypothetical protein
MFTPVLTMFTQSRFSGSVTCVACHSHACGVRASAGAVEEHSLARTGSFRSWKRVEYVMNRVDKLMLVECRAVIDPREDESRSCSELKLKLLS